ncbi:MAG: winged helix-turn-helix transcriptional regulator [Promethearchaeota archaeon]
MGRGVTDKLILIHPTRLQIYKIICESPGTYFYRLMFELPKYTEKISSATLIYHLKKLSEEKLIETTKIDGKRIYFPINLRNFEIERAYMLLKNENARNIFKYILNHDNAFQNEIARSLNLHHDTVYYHTQHLCDAGLIKKEKEGKFIRFHIGEIGKKLLDGSLNVITEEYIQFILSKLEDHCHFPEVLEKTSNYVKIRVVCPNEDDIEIEIKLRDFEFSIEEGKNN